MQTNKLKQPIIAASAKFTATSNQIIVGSGADLAGFKTTLNFASPAADRTLTIPALSANDSITYLAQAQSLSNKTLVAPIISGNINPTSNTLTFFLPDASYGSQSYFNIQQKAYDSPYDSIVTYAVVAPGNNNINPTQAYIYVGTLDDVTGSSVAFIAGSPLANFGFLEFFLNANTSGRGKLSVYNSSQAADEVMNFDSSIINFLKPISTDNIKPSGQDLNIRFPDASYGTRSYFNIQQKAVSSPYDSIITFAMGTYGNNNTNATEATLYIGTLDDVSGTSTRILCGGPETNFGILQFYINANTSTRGRLAVYNSSQSEVDVLTFDSTIITALKTLALGTNSLTMTGSIGATDARVLKGWFTDLTSTNAATMSITGNAATVTTNANLTGVITSTGNATVIASQTGTGTKFVVDNTPTLITPVLGVASATSINKVAITAPATSATLTIANGKTLTASNTLTFSGTDASTLNIGTGGILGTAAYKSTGTSGNTVALLNGYNTWSATQTFQETGLATGLQFKGSSSSVPYIWFDVAHNMYSSPTAIQSGDILTTFRVNGYTGSGYSNTAYFQSVADQNFTTSALKSRWDFYATPLDSATPQVALAIATDVSKFSSRLAVDGLNSNGGDFTVLLTEPTSGTRSYFSLRAKPVGSTEQTVFAYNGAGNDNVNPTVSYLYVGGLDDVTGSSVKFRAGGPTYEYGFLQFYLNANTSTHGRLTVYNSSQSEVDVMNFDSTIITLAKDALGNGSILSNSPSGGLGYAAGAGGTVTQATSKATGVTLNKICGQITTASDLLAAATGVTFTLTNSAIAATDLVDVQVASGASTVGSYQVECTSRASGSCTITIRNTLALTGLSEALVLTFAVKKVVIS